MMKDIVYEEIRRCNEYIRSISNESEKTSGENNLLKTVSKMVELSEISRKQGLLALEEEILNLHDICQGEYLKRVMMLIVDGTEPETVEEVGQYRYYADGCTGYEGLIRLMMLCGSLTIQRGDNPRIIEERILAMLPNEIEDKYQEYKENEYNAQTEGTSNAEFLDKKELEYLYEGDIAADPENKYYYKLKVLDYAINSLDDKGIQRLLRDVENSELVVSMKGLSGRARHRIFSNVSNKLALMLAEDMEYIGPVRLVDAVEASEHIFSILIRLIDCGEIFSADGDGLKAFKDVFDVARADEDVEKEREKAEERLRDIMRSYDEEKNKRVDGPKKVNA